MPFPDSSTINRPECEKRKEEEEKEEEEDEKKNLFVEAETGANAVRKIRVRSAPLPKDHSRALEGPEIPFWTPEEIFRAKKCRGFPLL